MATASKSRTGHAENGAGALGMLHAASQMTRLRVSLMTHLRQPNPYVVSALGSHALMPLLPKSDGPRSVVDAEPLLGISSFAFQASHERVICLHVGLLPFPKDRYFRQPNT